MKENLTDEKLQNKAEVEKIVENLTLFDDDLMSRVFDQNIPATELFLNIVLKQNVRVIRVVGQDEMKNPIVGRRNIRLDVHAIDECGREVDIEVQGNSSGAHVKRARFHSAMVDSRLLAENQDFKEIKDSYIIFMYKNDKFGKGLPVYHIERCVDETGESIDDGSHIIYVNGKYKGDDPIGKLVSDFHQTDADKMNYKEMADSVRHYKEDKEGCENMCEAVEQYGDRRAERATEKERLSSVKKLMENMKWTVEQALNALGIQGDERDAIAKSIMGQ